MEASTRPLDLTVRIRRNTSGLEFPWAEGRNLLTRSGSGRLPDFLILGEAKCGSTTLWQMLSRHAKVFFPAEKELHFFSSYADGLGQHRLGEAGLTPYLASFADARADQACGEATPNYLYDAGACARIRSVLPRARLIAILRDPVERAWSHYWHQVRRGWETLSFEEALAVEHDRISISDPNSQARYSYTARGRYVASLRRYEQAFSREQLMVVFLEELRSDPKLVIEGICRHIGVAEAGAFSEWDLPHANRGSYPRWPKLDSIARSVRRWADEAGMFASLPVQALGRVTRPLRVYRGAPQMLDATRRRVAASFTESDRELARWLGREPSWLLTPEHTTPGRA